MMGFEIFLVRDSKNILCSYPGLFCLAPSYSILVVPEGLSPGNSLGGGERKGEDPNGAE